MSHHKAPWRVETSGAYVVIVNSEGDRLVRGFSITGDTSVAQLMAASPKLLDDVTGYFVRQGREIDDIVKTLAERYEITEESARLSLMNNGVLTWKD